MHEIPSGDRRDSNVSAPATVRLSAIVPGVCAGRSFPRLLPPSALFAARAVYIAAVFARAAALPSSACRTLSKTGWYAQWESVLAGDAPDHSYRIGRQRACQERKHLVYGVDLPRGVTVSRVIMTRGKIYPCTGHSCWKRRLPHADMRRIPDFEFRLAQGTEL